MYTINDSKENYYHYSIPKWNASRTKLKEIHENLKKIYETEFKIGRKNIVDTTIYSNHWFRCPNQYKGSKDKTKHIIKVGTMIDFVITYIPEYSININEVKCIKPINSNNEKHTQIEIIFNSMMKHTQIETKQELNKSINYLKKYIKNNQ